MKKVILEINGSPVTADEGMTLLDAARQAGIEIPTLCSAIGVKPAGACRLCVVEIQKGKRRRIVASCEYPVEQGLVVQTDTPTIQKHRKLLLELIHPTATKLAVAHGVTSSRFATGQEDCNLCGLCVRYCNEVEKKNVLYFKGRGTQRRVAFVPGMEGECASCRKCFSLCTGGFVVSEHVRAVVEGVD